MKGYVIKTPEAKALRRVVKKYGTLNISDDNIEGGLMWLDHQRITKDMKNISKLKLNRVLRKFLINHLRPHLSIFSVQLSYAADIKTVKWIG